MLFFFYMKYSEHMQIGNMGFLLLQQAVSKHDHFWFGPHCITAPWANTTDVRHLIDFVDNAVKNRPKDRFQVAQCMLTPDTVYILEHMWGSLKAMAQHAMPAVKGWLKTKERGKGEPNIVIADCIELEDFPRTVIMLNKQ